MHAPPPNILSVSTDVKSLTRNLWQVWVGWLRTTGVRRHTLCGFSSSEMWPADRKTHNMTGDITPSSRGFMVVVHVASSTQSNQSLEEDGVSWCPCLMWHCWLSAVMASSHTPVFPQRLIRSNAHTLCWLFVLQTLKMSGLPCFADCFPGFDLVCSWPASLVSALVNHLSFCLILPLPDYCLSAWSLELGTFDSGLSPLEWLCFWVASWRIYPLGIISKMTAGWDCLCLLHTFYKDEMFSCWIKLLLQFSVLLLVQALVVLVCIPDTKKIKNGCKFN